MKSWQRMAAYILAAVLITASVSVAVTAKIIKTRREDTVTLSMAEYARFNDLLVLDEVMTAAEEDALNAPPARDAMIASAARGIVASLQDPYAAYYTAEEYEAYITNINGDYTGIGILLGQPNENGAVVLDIYEGYAAEAAGMQIGDRIIKVNDRSVCELTLEEISAEINGEVGATARLTVMRGEEQMEFNVKSMQIHIERVSSALFNERTAYIRIDMFTGNCVSEFESALKDKTERGMRSLVIDLRNNPGGSLEDVVSIADTLLGNCTIVSVRSKEGTEQVYKGKGKGVSVPIAVLVNENSASASEILSAAVQDHQKGVIVGMTTFGKGIVQTTKPLAAGGWLKLTTDAYYTPNGKDINGVGITPDIEVDLPDELAGTPIDKLDQTDDAQLWAALDYVRDAANEAA